MKTHCKEQVGGGICVCQTDGIYLIDDQSPRLVMVKMFDGECRFECSEKDCKVVKGNKITYVLMSARPLMLHTP